ncbi:MAG TPA: DUF1570 domain-containing protein [Phycisphaerae bacterium]|nr:DUF1570 domain-containing protein [Phycisphaerae bacterium]
MRQLSIILAAGLVVISAAAPARGQGRLQTYNTQYYVIHSDLDQDSVREAALRMTLMAEAYHERTKGFAGTIRKKLPFHLFRKVEDYSAAGGLPGSVGLFMGDKLMAVAGEKPGPRTWHIVQHEGFHQFVHAAIGGDVPTWVNEGLAEYFGEAIFTGDGYVVGLIPPQRLARIKHWMNEGQFRSLRAMMLTSYQGWKVGLSGANYDQAWSMVHFLAHAGKEKYRKPFGTFIRDVSYGKPWEPAWVRHLGTEVDAFEDRWGEYWENLPDTPTADLYAQATFATMNSFFARAFSQRQFFDTAEEFLEAAAVGDLKAHPDDWLPATLLTGALKRVEDAGKWSIEKRGHRKALVCVTERGTELVGDFKLGNRRVRSVGVDVRSKRK